MNDPLYAHLLDIVSDSASQGLILGGGFGMRVKQEYLQEMGEPTLIPAMPPARATQDLDFFLRMELFVQKERGQAVRALLDRLSYKEHTPQWQFGKPLRSDAATEETVKVDLLARTPTSAEPVLVKPPRVGSGAGIALHGHETPEAFAVEDSPLLIPVKGLRTDGVEVEATVFVPHPYAWLTMKVKAAHDWLRMEHGEQARKPFREKHTFDVYLLTTMLREQELEEAKQMAERYATHALASDIRLYAEELYGVPDAPGFREASRQAGERLDYETFREGLWTVLGIR